MNLNKFIPQWIIIMVKKVVKPGNGKVYELPNIILKPAPNDSNSDPLRQSEITELLSKIILLGRKRGRPSKKEEDIKDAA